MAARLTPRGRAPRRWRTRAAGVAALAVLTIAAAAARGEQQRESRGLRVLVEPPTVTAQLFYHGQTVRVSGTVPADREVAIVISGEDSPVELKVKGKVGGLIWTNVGDVTIDKAPSLYLAATSPGFGERTGTEAPEGGSVGYDAIESKCRVSPSGGVEEDHLVFTQFIKLKEKEELYAVAEGGVRLTAAGAGRLDCQTEFFIPPDAPIGTFDVRLFAIDRRHHIAEASADLTVEETGLAAAITRMARERGLLYGILSVVVALAAGLLAGVIFGLGSKGGH